MIYLHAIIDVDLHPLRRQRVERLLLVLFAPGDHFDNPVDLLQRSPAVNDADSIYQRCPAVGQMRTSKALKEESAGVLHIDRGGNIRVKPH